MRTRILPAVLVLAVASVGFGATCQEAKKDASVAVSDAQVACVVANIGLPDPTILDLCKVVDSLAPAIQKIISLLRVQIVQAERRGRESASTGDRSPVTPQPSGASPPAR